MDMLNSARAAAVKSATPLGSLSFLDKAKQAAAELKNKATAAAADLKDKARAHVNSIGTATSGVKEAAANTALRTIQSICSQLSHQEGTTVGARRRRHRKKTQRKR